MADGTMNILKTIGALIGIVVILATPITAITLATYTGNAAQKQAERAISIAGEAKSIGEQNARDFEYFKGEMTATMKAVNKSIDKMSEGHKDGLDKMDGKIDKVEGKVDELLKIMVRFERAGDGE
jgi:hypothetical protein